MARTRTVICDKKKRVHVYKVERLVEGACVQSGTSCRGCYGMCTKWNVFSQYRYKEKKTDLFGVSKSDWNLVMRFLASVHLTSSKQCLQDGLLDCINTYDLHT
ncbi:uncharacterized protein [Antedon mediterranea]|uniref:uncharacterized protein n=1 Tax=Antedon mediterranea TaxID=105859 RepID=UPI003AF7F5E7